MLIFPESHPRGSALSRLMASHVLKEHDTDGNGRVSTWVGLGLGLGQHDTDGNGRVENAELEPP